MPNSKETPVDVLIIGGGPAGLTAALSVARNLHTAIVFDSQDYRNARSNHFHMLPSWDGKDPKDFRRAARENTLENYDTISYQDVEVRSVEKNEDGLFQVIDTDEVTWFGSSLVLATGVIDVSLDIPGYDECWGRSIFHCLFCHGYEQRGSESSGVLDMDDQAPAIFTLHVARNAAQLTEKVTIYTNGNETRAEEMRAAAAPISSVTVDHRKIVQFALGPDNTGCALTFEDGSTNKEAFLANKPKNKLKSSELIQQLGCKTTPQGDVEVSGPFGETSVSGCFAAGDNSGFLKTVLNAIHVGSTVAAGVASHVQSKKYGQESLVEYLRAKAPPKPA